MKTYSFSFPTPSPLREFVQTIEGVGAVDEIGPLSTTIEITAETEYELGRTVTALESELTTIVNDMVHIEGKPILVQD